MQPRTTLPSLPFFDKPFLPFLPAAEVVDDFLFNSRPLDALLDELAGIEIAFVAKMLLDSDILRFLPVVEGCTASPVTGSRFSFSIVGERIVSVDLILSRDEVLGLRGFSTTAAEDFCLDSSLGVS